MYVFQKIKDDENQLLKQFQNNFPKQLQTKTTIITTPSLMSPVGSDDVKSTIVSSPSTLMWYAAEVIVGSRAPPSAASSPEQLPTSPSHDIPRQTRRHVRPFDWQPTVASRFVRLIQNVVGNFRLAQPVTANVN